MLISTDSHVARLLLFGLLLVLIRHESHLRAGEGTVYLDQGWTDDERTDFYGLTQGSQLMPYDWFLALERRDDTELLRSERFLKSLGHVLQPRNARWNPDGLPIGFSKDDNPATVDETYSVKRGFLGRTYDRADYPLTNVWLGFNCALCHTAEITYEGQTIRIDGGPALVDHERFLDELVQALRATHDDDEKFSRFAKRVLGADNLAETPALRKRVAAYTEVLERLALRNKAEHPYGFARLDAFGAILNQICETALEIPENHRTSNAPVSFPHLWYAPHLDWVQWNGSAANPIDRNVGEVLGVYAHLKLTGTLESGQFTSTARIDHLFRLEQSLAKLKAPAWPRDILGAPDPGRVKAGERLYAANCARCHHLRDEHGRFPMTEPNQAGKQFIRTVMVPYQQVGTDPQMVLNFIGRKAKPGALREFLPDPFRNAPEVPAGLLLKVAVKGVIQNRLDQIQPRLDDEQLAELNGFRDRGIQPPNPAAYKAAPLTGVWATAPYLHSGAVPNLYELLLPDNQRAKSFWVGSREFDPVKVGFRTDRTEGGFEFRTETAEGIAIPGNSNAGHCGPHYTQTRTANGAFRDFTDEERWALVEYLKSLY